MPWYIEQKREFELSARKHNFSKVSHLKLAIVKKIQNFVLGGGFLFAMCSATETFDLAISAEGLDICDRVFDGDPMTPQAQSKLNFENTFAFENFTLNKNYLDYEFSDIDTKIQNRRGVKEENDFFNLFEFSAKWDPYSNHVDPKSHPCH